MPQLKWRYGGLCAIFLLLSGCIKTPTVIKIGLVAPFEGSDRAIGYDAIYAARLAVREVNQTGGINGSLVALVALDDSSQIDLAGKNAQTLIRDPAVIAVIGHGIPLTTQSAAVYYREANIAFIPLSLPPFEPFPAAGLPADFTQRYQDITPFDEQPGPFAAPTYDAFQLLFTALAQAQNSEEKITRQNTMKYLPKSTHEGITGSINMP